MVEDLEGQIDPQLWQSLVPCSLLVSSKRKGHRGQLGQRYLGNPRRAGKSSIVKRDFVLLEEAKIYVSRHIVCSADVRQPAFDICFIG